MSDIIQNMSDIFFLAPEGHTVQTCKNKFLCPKKANAHIIYRNIAVIFADVPCKTRNNVKK